MIAGHEGHSPFPEGVLPRFMGSLLRQTRRRGPANNNPGSLSGTVVPLGQLFFSHTKRSPPAIGWAEVNNHIAKSTELPSRVLTSFERCQLALGLTQAGLGWAGLGVGEEMLDRGSGECASAGCGVF